MTPTTVSELRPRRRLALAIALALAAATLALYSRVVGFDFVDFDDDAYVTANAFVQRGLTLDGVVWAFSSGHAANWHPLTWLSHMLDCTLYGLNPAGHHLTSAVLHVLNAVALFVLLVRTTGATGRSGFVAGLFALHPLHVESVAWVAERKDVLSTLCALLALLAYERYARRGTLAPYTFAGLFLALGLAAKPMLVTLPFVFLLLDGWPLDRLGAGPRRGGRAAVLVRRLVEKIPFFALAAATSVVTLVVQGHGGAVKSAEFVPWPGRLANAVLAYVRYLRLTLWPDSLAVHYPHPYLPGGTHPHGWPVLGSALLLAGLSVLALYAARWGRPYVLAGWLWFLGMLLPVIGLVQVGTQGLADRYTYLPLVGVFILVAWGAADLAAGLPRSGVAVLALGVLAACAARSWYQLGTWRDSITLYRQALAVAPTNPLVHNNLGVVLQAQGRLEEAVEHYRRALEIDPGSAGPYNNLAGVLLGRGDVAGALEHYRRALELDPDYARAHNGLGNALVARGRPEEAIEHYRRAIALEPTYADAHYNLGNTLGASGRLDEAIEHYRRALELRPGDASARNNLGNALLAWGRIGEAIDEFRRALEIEPALAPAHNGLGVALMRAGRARAALEQFRLVARLEPESTAPLVSMAWVLATDPAASPDEAREAVALAERAARLAGYPEATVLDTLAAAYAAAGRFDEAVATAERALGRAPPELAGHIRERLDSYRSSRPYRRPEPATARSSVK